MRAALLTMFVLGLSGCPRDLDVPDPGSAETCATLADCNGGAVCGELRACVDSLCEEMPSLVVPCRDAAVR